MLRSRYTANTMSRAASPAQKPRMIVLGGYTDSCLMTMASSRTAKRPGS